MIDLFTKFLTAFIPMFVAMDCLGILPLYVSIAKKTTPENERVVLKQAIIAAVLLGLLFTVLGLQVFDFLGITVADFMVGGGVILLILAITDLLFPDQSRSSTEMGVVPLGIPLIVGPSVLTTLVLQVDLVGLVPTVLSFLANIAITYFVFRSKKIVVKALGESGTHAISKIANLFLAAIAVMLIRKGFVTIVQNHFSQ